MIDRSALVLTVSVSLAVLLVALGSLVVLLTVAVLVWLAVVADGTVYLLVKVAEAPEASVPSPYTSLFRSPWVTVVEPSLKPAGKASATDTPWASEGPLLLTVMV